MTIFQEFAEDVERRRRRLLRQQQVPRLRSGFRLRAQTPAKRLKLLLLGSMFVVLAGLVLAGIFGAR